MVQIILKLYVMSMYMYYIQSNNNHSNQALAGVFLSDVWWTLDCLHLALQHASSKASIRNSKNSKQVTKDIPM